MLLALSLNLFHLSPLKVDLGLDESLGPFGPLPHAATVSKPASAFHSDLFL